MEIPGASTPMVWTIEEWSLVFISLHQLCTSVDRGHGTVLDCFWSDMHIAHESDEGDEDQHERTSFAEPAVRAASIEPELTKKE